jgi:glycine oxidase
VQVTVIGAGVAGLTCAVELAERGIVVELLERGEDIGRQSCSWYAGGMLAPWCERERLEPLISSLGVESMRWWQERFPGTRLAGSLVVAHGRDRGELTRFSQRTERHEWLNRDAVGMLEPDLAGRFANALFFAEEGQLDPRDALRFLAHRLVALGGQIRFNTDGSRLCNSTAPIVDCTGLAARAALVNLRGVKGEMLVLRSHEVDLSRPVRVLHPRIPVYVVPRGNGVFMVGATMVESDDSNRITARSVHELLSAAHALHPAFADAEIVEIGTQVRPAFPDNLPKLRHIGNRLYVNGLYRHGFLVAPALARRAADAVLNNQFYPEVMDEDPRERHFA